jgi:hypothetical protein
MHFMSMHSYRAERFGTMYVDPAKVKPEFSLEAKKEKLRREGFATGFDTLSAVSETQQGSNI